MRNGLKSRRLGELEALGDGLFDVSIILRVVCGMLLAISGR